ncbi:hypothetical protein BLNAU_11070 [Blattamonas nauphoetae]|uniref:Uncharacterized protein n=1 Tax=Blattamonas nauphoetae TaxID=2049346 RepID=A0ABQ9XNI2_9EUKA|nr:hypothetical protein BLNAU_11070 [Blattamonas nauphoetae]
MDREQKIEESGDTGGVFRIAREAKKNGEDRRDAVTVAKRSSEDEERWDGDTIQSNRVGVGHIQRKKRVSDEMEDKRRREEVEQFDRMGWCSEKRFELDCVEIDAVWVSEEWNVNPSCEERMQPNQTSIADDWQVVEIVIGSIE